VTVAKTSVPVKGGAERARAPRTKATLPTVPAEKVLEESSRAIFKEALSPWLVTDWQQHDYGIDAMVEVTRERGSANFDATGKRFAVQLKATKDDVTSRVHAPVRVRPEQVRYWNESTEPVLLALCHVPTRTIFWRWIDHAVVDELTRRDAAWIGQETVTINLATTQVLDAAAKAAIAKFVTAFRRSARRVLAPGRYVDVHTRLLALAQDLTSRAKSAGFQSVLKRLADLESSVRGSTYVVALTGPARAGKSTLLNALIGRAVSPVGRLPTTAVSLLVTAGARDEAEVVLANDERVRGEATAVFLEQYATQEKNPDNGKGVRMIGVRLVNELLERGVAYADAPGLHDPSENIRAVTETALNAAHAVLYVLDVSPAKNGGFSLTNHQLDDLKRLRAMADRLLVVLNKADVLSDEERNEVAEYLQQTLTKYGLWESLPSAPMFVSASASWDWQNGGRAGPSPLAALDDAIWSHLLHTNSTGIDRLRVAATELHRSADEFAALLAARRLSGTEAHRLRTALAACRGTEHSLVARCRQQRTVEEQLVARRIVERRDLLLGRLQKLLKAVPVDRPLPPPSQLEKEIQQQAISVLTDVWRDVGARVQAFATAVSQEVEESLQQARLATDSKEPMRFHLPQVPTLNLASDSLEEAWFGLFTGGLFGLIVGGPWAWAWAAGGWLAGIVLGREKRRAREIARVVERARSSLDASLGSVQGQIQEKTTQYLATLERHVTDRVTVFVHDVESQLGKHELPIDPEEARRLEGHERAVRGALGSLADVRGELEHGQLEPGQGDAA
jgi:GTP-binding protein EngB required for normal cell division